VQVVDAHDPYNVRDPVAHGRDPGVAGSALEQHIGGLAHDADNARDDDRSDQQRQRRIEPSRTRQRDQHAAQDDGAAAQRVPSYVQDRRADIEVCVAAADEHQSDRQIHG